MGFLLSDFFEPPPPLAESLVYREHRWVGPPRGTLPGFVAIALVLARTDTVAVCLSHIAAYPAGFEFEILTMAAPGLDADQVPDPMMHGPGSRRGADASLPAEMLRIGIQFTDGAKATNTSGFDHNAEAPNGPVMTSRGGSGGMGQWRQAEWVWPLPPPGPLTFVCEWPACGIPLTGHEIDSQTILDAAAQAQTIFSDEHLPERPNRTVTP